MGIDDFPAPIFDQATQAVGASSIEVRAYLEYHEEHGHSSESDRKAWSRARAKVEKGFPRAKLTSLLVMVFALSLALLNAIHNGRSIDRDDLVNQDWFIHQKALAHRVNLKHQKALASLDDIHQ